MLFADKQQLQHQLEVDLLALRQKELDHFTMCCLTLSSPAALIAGFAYTGIAEVTIPEDTHWAMEGLYYIMTVSAMLFQIAATIRASLVALMGPALALRGKAGSMHRSVEAMEPCFRGAWRNFLAGMFCILMSTLINVFQQSQYWASATFVGVGIVLATVEIYRDILYVSRRFNLPANEVERGAFTRQEVRSMFKGRRGADPNRRKLASRSVTSTILIQAAEGVPVVDGARRGAPISQRERAGVRLRRRRSSSGNSESGDIAQDVQRPARVAGARTVRFEISERGEAAGPPLKAAPPVPARAEGARRLPRLSLAGLRRNSPKNPAGSEKGAQPFSKPSSSPFSKPSSLRRGGSMLQLGTVAVPGQGPQGEVGVSADEEVIVVLTVRDGKRLRWQVLGGTTILELQLQAELYFDEASLIEYI